MPQEQSHVTGGGNGLYPIATTIGGKDAVLNINKPFPKAHVTPGHRYRALSIMYAVYHSIVGGVATDVRTPDPIVDWREDVATSRGIHRISL